MFKHHNFIAEIRTFLAIFSVFGLWPSWHTSKYRLFHTLYSFLSILVVIGISIAVLMYLDMVENTTLSAGVTYSFILSGLFVHFIIVLQAFFCRKKQHFLINKFAYVDQLLHRNLQVQISYREEKHQILVRILTIGFLLIVIELSFRAQLIYCNAISLEFWLYCFYSELIMRIRCLQVLVFVLLLRSRINIISSKVKEILIATNRRELKALSTQRPFAATGEDETIFVLDTSNAKYCSTYERLLHIKQIYGELYEVCDWINTIFGWSLLAIVTQCFIHFTNIR